jgi:Fe-S-cluster containining protein
LSGIVGKDVTCDFYEIRPQMCRDFEPKSEDCIRCRNYAFGFGPYW